MNQPKKRTQQQNKAIHVYFREVANFMKEHGITMKVLLDKFNVDIEDYVIKAIFREIGLKKFGKDSTAKLTTSELSTVYEEVNRQFAKEGIFIPFPSLGSIDEATIYERGYDK